ncbi:MAG: undecaprenyldiphospho-muramoylpentapeptide beta-N-acetylglucosaminyltransferase [Bacteroidales bacterium]|nr:undecaprenyldiphospho-muramoylpentapeptide beta-N-acetylglucosaminyltransferase [Bacteroidales bacterium]
MKVIISGGGTGGHIFPALAIANAITERYPNSNILFIGAIGKMEMEKVPAAGYPIEGLPIAGLQRKLSLKNLLLPIKLFKSQQRAKEIIKNFEPDIVVGVGGYASAPTLKMAEKLGYPTILQEQNSYPGLTNKMLAKKSNKICVAYDGLERFFPKEKIVFTGNPVRKSIEQMNVNKAESTTFFELDSTKKTILSIGGSLGARSINEALHANIAFFTKNDIQLIWQTGKWYYNTAKKAVAEAKAENNIKVFDFISAMDKAYCSADCIISRSGAIAISELCLVGKPTILIPSPNVSEDHQTKNAMALVTKGAAIMIADNEITNNLALTLSELIKDEEKQSAMSKACLNMGVRDAANKIVDEIDSIIKQR